MGWRTSFSIFSSLLLVTVILVFTYLKMSFFHPQFWKIIFAGYRILGSQWALHCLLAFIVSDEKLAIIYTPVLFYVMCPFFHFIFSFSSLNVMWLVGYLCKDLVCGSWNFLNNRWCFSINPGNFGPLFHYFFKYFFVPHSFLFGV